MTFYHGPCLGDVVYALPTIRAMGGGTLLLDGHDAYRARFERMLGLLRRQPYLEHVRLYNGERFEVDLEHYTRVGPMLDRARFDLVAAHFLGQGRDTPPDAYRRWLTVVPDPVRRPVVVHRSARYRSLIPEFDFLVGLPPEDLFVVGYPDEAEPFCRRYGATWVDTPEMDDLAGVIASCEVFVGNQSSPLALAVALGKPRLVEECPWWPNCDFPGAAAIMSEDHHANREWLGSLRSVGRRLALESGSEPVDDPGVAR